MFQNVASAFMGVPLDPDFAVGLQNLPEGSDETKFVRHRPEASVPKQAILWLFGVNPDKFSRKISSAEGKFATAKFGFNISKALQICNDASGHCLTNSLSLDTRADL
jgi:hypothetical protein